MNLMYLILFILWDQKDIYIFLQQKNNELYNIIYKINGIFCLMGDGLCRVCLWVSQCLSLSLSLPVDSLCEGNPNLRLPHDTECQLYYDCSAEEPPIFSPAEKYLRECKYPMLFSTKSMKCEDFESVVCSSRKELKQMCKSIVLHFVCFETQNAHNIFSQKRIRIAILFFPLFTASGNQAEFIRFD